MLRVAARAAGAFLLETVACTLAAWWAGSVAVRGSLSDLDGGELGCCLVLALIATVAALLAHAIVLGAGGPRWVHTVVTILAVAGTAGFVFVLAAAGGAGC